MAGLPIDPTKILQGIASQALGLDVSSLQKSFGADSPDMYKRTDPKQCLPKPKEINIEKLLELIEFVLFILGLFKKSSGDEKKPRFNFFLFLINLLIFDFDLFMNFVRELLAELIRIRELLQSINDLLESLINLLTQILNLNSFLDILNLLNELFNFNQDLFNALLDLFNLLDFIDDFLSNNNLNRDLFISNDDNININNLDEIIDFLDNNGLIDTSTDEFSFDTVDRDDTNNDNNSILQEIEDRVIDAAEELGRDPNTNEIISIIDEIRQDDELFNGSNRKRCPERKFEIEDFTVSNGLSQLIITPERVQNLKAIYDKYLIPIVSYYKSIGKIDNDCSLYIGYGLLNPLVAVFIKSTTIKSLHIDGKAINFRILSISPYRIMKDILEEKIVLEDYGVLYESNGGLTITLPYSVDNQPIIRLNLSHNYKFDWK
jgi:hypothetical protein